MGFMLALSAVIIVLLVPLVADCVFILMIERARDKARLRRQVARLSRESSREREKLGS